MKILLISANTLSQPYPVYPLGLDYVAGALTPHHQVRIVDMNELSCAGVTEPRSRGDEIQTAGTLALGRILREERPDLIGLSLRNVDNTDTADPEGFLAEYGHLARTVRQHSNAPLVLGGSGFTLFPREMMLALDADYGIIGEGERLGQLAAALENGGDVSRIPGLLSRGDGGQPTRPWRQAFPRRFDGDAPHLEFYLRRGGMLNLQTKRGCPFRCIYCTYPRIEGADIRLLPPSSIAETAVMLERSGAKYLFITDSVFNADESHSLAVAEAFREAKLSIPWGGFFAPFRPAADYYRRMGEAGLTHVEFGTEALSPKMLAVYRKPFGVDHVMAAHRAAVDAGLHTAHYFLLGGPGEDRETLAETLSNIDKLDRTVLFFFCGIRIYPNTELYDIALAEGQITGTMDMTAPVFYASAGISKDEIIRRVRAAAGDRMNWVLGAGGEETNRVLSRLHARGHTGPLWEHLVR